MRQHNSSHEPLVDAITAPNGQSDPPIGWTEQHDEGPPARPIPRRASCHYYLYDIERSTQDFYYD